MVFGLFLVAVLLSRPCISPCFITAAGEGSSLAAAGAPCALLGWFSLSPSLSWPRKIPRLLCCAIVLLVTSLRAHQRMENLPSTVLGAAEQCWCPACAHSAGSQPRHCAVPLRVLREVNVLVCSSPWMGTLLQSRWRNKKCHWPSLIAAWLRSSPDCLGAGLSPFPTPHTVPGQHWSLAGRHKGWTNTSCGLPWGFHAWKHFGEQDPAWA